MKRSTIIAKSFFFILLVLCILASAVNTVIAGTLTFDYDYTFSGTSPSGSTPYFTSTFDDNIAGTGYDVRLTIFAENLDPGKESITKLYFNLDPTLNASLLEFNAIYNSDAVPNSVTGKDNDYIADGDGYYDVYFDMPPPPGDYNVKFTDNEILIYDIGYSGAATLTAQSFNFISALGGGMGEYYAAAHIQGITPGNDSGWVAAEFGVVPEPISSILFLAGGATLGFRRFRKANKV